MSAPRDEQRQGLDRAGLDPRLHPASEHDNALGLADELFVHGLISHLASDVEAEREKRVRAVMAALPARPLRLGDGRIVASSSLVSWAAAAMLLIAVGALSLFTASSEPSAAAMVRESLAAASSAGDRSYRLTTLLPEDVPFAPPPARLDVRDRSHQLLTALAPDGVRFTIGRDEQGAWVLRPDGAVERFGERQPGPRWIDLGQNLFLAESIDEVLTTLPSNFVLSADVAAPLPASTTMDDAAATALLRRISAVRVDRGGPEPQRIELWIDPSTRLVERMELHWDDAAQCGPRRHERNERWGAGGGGRAGGWADRPPGPPPGWRPGSNAGDSQGPEGPRGPRGAMEPPVPLAPRPDREPLDAARVAPPPLLAAPDPRRAARGFLDRPPDLRRREHPPAPRAIIFERIPTAPFADDWFSPERHAGAGEFR